MRRIAAKVEKSVSCGGGARSTLQAGWGAFPTVASRSIRQKPTDQGLVGMSLGEPVHPYSGPTTRPSPTRPLTESRPTCAENGDGDNEAAEASSSGSTDVP